MQGAHRHFGGNHQKLATYTMMGRKREKEKGGEEKGDIFFSIG